MNAAAAHAHVRAAHGRLVIAQFFAWMLEHRGVRESTLTSYSYPLRQLLDSLGDDPSAFTASALRAFIRDHAAGRGSSYARRGVTASRMFLRFLSADGRCAPALVDAIPAVAGWKLAQLPRYLTPETVARAVARCDTATPLGLRDRAALLLCSRLGLRASDVRDLLIDDLDFAHGVVRVAGKNRSEARLPLPQDVGDALLSYLESGRPRCRSRHVFVRRQEPIRAFKSSSAISAIVKAALRRAGVRIWPCGAHTLRHSAAFRLLQEGASLETIGSVLRHASIDTTAIYAKVDIAALREIAQPWPAEVAPC